MKYRVLKRRVVLGAGPIESFHALSDGGRAEGHCLLETADAAHAERGSNMLLLSPCLRVTATREDVILDALTENGRALLRRLEKTTRRLLDVSENRLVLRYAAGPPARDEIARLQSVSPLDAIRSVLTAFSPSCPDEAEDLIVAGVFNFETIEWVEHFEPFATAASEVLCTLYVPEIVVRFPRDSRHCLVSATIFDGEQRARVENEISRRMAEIAEKLPTLEARPTRFEAVQPVADVCTEDDAYCLKVERAKAHLRAGDAFQIVLSRRFYMPCADPLLAYRALREENPSPYMFYMVGNGFTVFGASPESAVKVSAREGILELCPIAGTRARGRTASGDIDWDLDARVEADLRSDEKEIAEHMMLVDLARNDVARICRPGTRNVHQLLSVERYSRVMHLVSRVRGKLREEIDALRAFSAVMPMGTLSGAPKIRVIEIIRQLEGQPRDSYGGAVGYIDAAGNMDTAITIRAASVRSGVARVQAGAGIVLKSDPVLEANETRRKAESVLRAIASANCAGDKA